MDLDEQQQLYLWIEGLLAKLEMGEVEDVKSQLKIALGRVEEDRHEHGITESIPSATGDGGGDGGGTTQSGGNGTSAAEVPRPMDGQGSFSDER